MTNNHNEQQISFGYVEPHKAMLEQPADNQLLYKIMSAENLINSISGGYLHFNRVDRYKDFSKADQHDGVQMPSDLLGNINSKFVKNPNVSWADTCNKSRARTYACCFSLENSDYIWENYSKGSKKGQICLVLNFGKLRDMLNNTLLHGQCILQCDNIAAQQIFSINYGIIQYIDLNDHQTNEKYLSNPIKYSFLKSNEYVAENELRILLSAPGVGEFILGEKSLDFKDHLHMTFNYADAFRAGIITQILTAENCDKNFLKDELGKFNIFSAEGSD